MESKIIEVSLPNGGVALVQARTIDGGSGATKTGVGRADFAGVAKTLGGVAEAIHGALEKAAPSKVRVELGIELAVKSGGLVGLIVDGDTSASLTVTLEWERARE